MSYDWGSSWVYEQILTFHVRFARATPENALRFGGRPKQTSSNSFHPSIAPTFRSLVLDPEDFINETGHCLAVSIILTILIQFEKVPSTSVRKNQITKLLRHLRYQQFLQPKTKKQQAGISLENFQDVEKANSPLPLELVESCPSLKSKKGLAINVFRAIPRKLPDEPPDHLPTIFIFPTMLSTKNTDEDYLQVDLLLDSADLRPNQIEHNHDDRTSPTHILCIPNLLTLLIRNSPYKTSKYAYNTRYYTHFCRSCSKLYSCIEDLTLHRNFCRAFPTGGNRCKKRRAQNQKVTTLYKINPFTGAKEKNGLFFKRSHLFR